MPQTLKCWTITAALGLLGAAGAVSAPALPSATLAQEAVRDAMTPVRAAPATTPVVAPVAAPVTRAPVTARPAQPARPQTPTAAQTAANRAAQVARAQAQAAQRAAQARAQAAQGAQRPAAPAPLRTGRSVIARATAYNSTPGQTDSTPFITATGTRTRPGVVALSRDLLRSFPYGSRITIEDLSGRYNSLLRGRVFYVEDTMASYKRASVDIWMTTRTQAIQFGARQVRITAVR